MFTLPLSDPLWRKLDDAHRDRDIPDVLRALLVDWDEEKANSLFWDCLCHQDTCYGATYASVPHLLEISQQPPAPEAVESIAHFLGHVSMVAFQAGGCCGSDENTLPQGLPLDLTGWDRKLDPYRSSAEHARKELADPDYPDSVLGSFDSSLFQPLADKIGEIREAFETIAPEALKTEAKEAMPMLSRESRQAELDHYTELLSRPAVNEADLEVLAKIRDAFLQAQDAIAVLCTQAYQVAEDPEDRRYFLAGLMAAMGDRSLALLLEHGDEGGFSCHKCDWQYEYSMYEQGLACYASPVGPSEMYARTPGDDPAFLDNKDGAPNRADGFVQPREEFRADTPGSYAMELVKTSRDQENGRRLRFFTGTYLCRKCSTRTQLA